MRARMEDVARLAGVSTATVSRVVNKPECVSHETRQRVMDAIGQLEYKINLAARSLRTNQTRTIAILIPTIAEPVINQLVEAVEDVAVTENYSLLMCSTRGDSAREQAYIQQISQQTMVDGVLYVSPRSAPEQVLELANSDVPLVLCNYHVEGTGTPCILADHVSSIYQTTSHLLAFGHRRIALLNLAALHYYPARMRREGFENAFAAAGLSPDPDLVVELREPTYDANDWRGVINELLDHAHPPTAIVAFNDKVALEVYAVCRARGLCIPHDLSVTGCDDILSARYLDPPLTTVRIPAYELGQLAMQTLLMRINQTDPTIHKTTLLDVELVVRESCAPPEQAL
ncbi:MAG: LacI family DNA-binding transcriptional regulator [Anaerolineae bacterium]|nr:LacI family DNA-binding transcriptional regulator [Anaerolineae bacterium]